jgi:hypothetical protein
LSSEGDDFRFTHMVLGVEDDMRDVKSVHHAGERFRGIDTGCTDENGLTFGVDFSNTDNGCDVFIVSSLENQGIQINPAAWFVSWNRKDVEFVDVVEFRSLRFGSACHACQFAVHAEVVLNCDRGVGEIVLFQFEPFFGSNGLVETV